MRVIALLALCIAAVAAVPSNPQRIVGGSTTTISAYPSIVALLFSMSSSNHMQACGGTIINNRSILTAAHCTIGNSPSQWRIRAGSTFSSSGGVVHNVNRIINHPSYNQVTIDNDIAVLRSSSAFSFNNNVRAASIAGSNYNHGDNQVVWAAGWGRIYQGGPTSETLRHVQIWTINQNTCRNRYATVGMPITDNMFCSGWLDVGGRDTCTQDSGGPIYHNGVVVGVCSFGIGCAQAQFPGVNARVSRFTYWIQNNA